MKTIKFKTNIKCGGCVASVTPFLNSEESISTWQVDTANPQKILTVSGDKVDAKKVSEVISRAGFKAEAI